MKQSDYQISPYTRSQMPDVVRLLQELLGGDAQRNAAYFEWKHHDNPYADEPLGVVATCEGAVVGFRGYFATSWYLGSEDNRTIILLPGDTVVDPQHRRKNLSVAMGNYAMERYADTYRVFLNMTAGENSVPGYLRLGFAPVGIKSYYTRRRFVGHAKAILRKVLKRQSPVRECALAESRISFGSFGDIAVSAEPRPVDMARLSRLKAGAPKKISLFQDEAFFDWRFRNPKAKYAFYYYRQDDKIVGYLVMSVSANAERGSIVDHGQDVDGAIGRILDHIIERKHFEGMSILSLGVDDALWRTLKSRRFAKWSLQRHVQRRTRGEWPVLVRPVKREYSDADWFLQGTDIRAQESWNLKAICGDGA